MALPVPFDPPPNTPPIQNASVWAQWARWFWQIWKRIKEGALGGTVTSVGLSLPTSVFDVSGSPVTTSGTLAATFDTQSANTAFMGPTSGGAATPAFRALVAADIPTNSPLTIGTTPIVSGTVSRLLYEGAGNLLAESANLTFNGTTLSVSGLSVAASSSTPIATLAQSGAGRVSDFIGGTGEIIRLGLTPSAGVQQTIGIGFATGSTNTNPAALIEALEFGPSDSRASLLFYTRGVNSDSAPSLRARIAESGNFRILDALRVGSDVAPTVALDVTGAALISSTLGVTGAITSGTLTSGRLALVGTAGLITDDSGITYDAAANSITATTFNGALNGNATTATTATTATNVTVANEATDTSCFILFATAATGDLGAKSNANMTFNSSTGVITLASAVLTTADINGGTIDGSTIGGSTPGAGTFTDLTVNGNTILGSDSADTVTVNAETVSSPNIPLFLAYLSANTGGVTGAGTNYTIICDTEVKDQSGDYNTTTGIFTAPAAGTYHFDVAARLAAVSTAMTQRLLLLVTSNRSYGTLDLWAPNVTANTSHNISSPVDMDAGDTAFIRANYANGAGDTAVVVGASTLYTRFGGQRVA